MALNLEVNILGDYSKLTKATKGAQKQLSVFEKTSKKVSVGVNNVVGKVAAAFAIQRIGRFLLDSAKAAGEDTRAQRILALTMQRVAKAKNVDVASTEALISRMEAASGILDDELRPAFSKLVSTTKNVHKAQTLLKLALGASAKSGKPLVAVTDAISKAYNGNLKTLVKMFPEINKSKHALKDLAKVSHGMAAANADPFQQIQVGIANVKETIGGPIAKKLSDFMHALFSNQNKKPMQELNDAISGMADSIGVFFGAFAKNGDSATGFLTSVETIANAIAGAIETAAFFINTLQGKKINYKLYPHLLTPYGSANTTETGGSTDNLHKKTADKGPLGFLVPGNKDYGKQLIVPKPAPAPTPSIKNTYNITTQTTDKLTAQTVVRMIQNYEKQSGKKYFVSSSVA